MSGADRHNRLLLLLFGVLIMALGIMGVLAGVGVFGNHLEHEHLYASHAGHFVGRNGVWLWPVAALVSVLVGVLALLWLKAQGTSPRVSTVLVPSPAKQGRTFVESGALTEAITSEIGSYRGVRSAKAHLLGAAGDPRLRLFVTLDSRAEFGELRARIESEAVANARAAMDAVRLPVLMDFDVSTKTGKRV